MDYQGVLDYLKGIELMGIQPGLDNTKQILNHFPSFDSCLKKTCFIQVAGTNGKGSTSYFLKSIFQSAGYKVGLFTSPHLFDVRERIIVNSRWIAEDDFAQSVSEVKEISEGLVNSGVIPRMPSYFEYTFLTAIHYFFKAQVEVAILEVGLGGRWDATSTITPSVSVITTISKDHTSILGRYLKDIASEKAGIIKKGIPVVCGCPVGSIAHRIIKSVATQNKASYFSVIDSKNRLEIETLHHPYKCKYFTALGDFEFVVSLNGKHQTKNAATAIKTIQVLKSTNPLYSIPPEAIEQGISNTAVPGRIESFNTNPPVIIDGGHNVESTSVLVQYLHDTNKQNLTLIFGVLTDKNYKKMASMLTPFTGNIILTEPQSSRALPVSKLLKLFNGKPVIIKKGLEEAYNTARQLNKPILITGSFYLVGAMRKIILAGG